MGIAAARSLEALGMDAADLEAVSGDDQKFKYFVISSLSGLSERVSALSDKGNILSREVDANRDKLVQIDTSGTHGLSDLRERIAAHDRFMSDFRNAISDHMSTCPLFSKVDTLMLDSAKSHGARSQLIADWKMTLTMLGMLLTTVLTLIGMFHHK